MRTDADDPILASPRQAQRTLDISNSTFYALIRSGQLPSLLIGRARRVPMAAIRKFVAQRLTENPNKPRRGRPRKIPAAPAQDSTSIK
jgi:excisionase family DNA binding protein